ncbi:MAG: DNA mismatch repair protein MutS, partial [Eubacteriales bacterium]|nr:DNA mismatch repair protein MutS [Eubacteriales bacterium]
MPVTPMMQQYLDMKSQYPDCIMFFRLGDFYEMFYEDAQLASKELEITLTGRDCGLEERAPMCGIPFHAADSYIAKLISKSYKVAICEQVEDPSLAMGLVKRDVIRVITPGTVTENSMLSEKRNNYLMCIYQRGYFYGLCVADISTGDLLSTSINWGNTEQKLLDEIFKFAPSEILVNTSLYNESRLINGIKSRCSPYVTLLEDELFDSDKCEEVVKERFEDCELLGEENNIRINAAGALLQYLNRTQKQGLSHLQRIECYNIEEYMALDSSTRRNLELTETIRDKVRKGSLLWVIDRTVTSMGARRLRKWLEQPLVKKYDIITRLDAVEELKNKFMARMELMELLQSVYDIERLAGRIAIGSANCRDLTALKKSVSKIPYIKTTINNFESEYIRQINSNLDELSDVEQLIDESVIDDPPLTVKEGGIIKQGYSPDVDRLRDAMKNGKEWIAGLESSERKRTGIKNLKIGFNKVFGYFIEITKSNYESVPDDYIRKQTLVNCERYITPELKEMENEILGAEDKLIALEYDLFMQVKNTVAKQIRRLKSTAVALSELDALASLAETADREFYCRPEITDDDRISITEGRHPVVEKMMNKGVFVPNDTLMDLDDNRLLIITGPNMAGKSTYMRQTALIVVMAQIGCFVPASQASIGLDDRIFTRV